MRCEQSTLQAMRYEEYRDAIRDELRRNPRGLTWAQLKDSLDLPYNVPCPDWTRRMEAEIGLSRAPGPTRAFVWTIRRGAGRKRSAAARVGVR